MNRRAHTSASDEKRLVFAITPGWDQSVVMADLTRATPPARSATCAAWVRSLGTLPSLPDVYYRLNEVLERPRSSAKRSIARVIEDDVALAARVLRLVNSSFYGFPGRIDAIPQALAILGTEEIEPRPRHVGVGPSRRAPRRASSPCGRSGRTASPRASGPA